MQGSIGFCSGDDITICMDGLLDGSSAVLADLPVCIVVAFPTCHNVIMCTACIVVAKLQALVVGIAPVFCKVFTLYAEVVVAAHRRDVGPAAFVAEFAIVAAVQTFVAIATFLTDEVVEVILERTVVWAIAVFAVIVAGTVLALAAVFAEFVWLEAVTTVGTEVLVPIAAFRTDAVFAVVVFLTFFTQHAIRTFCIVWAFLAIRTNVLSIFARLDAIAMRTTRVFRIGLAASLAKAAIVAKLLTFTFYASAALIAKPAVFLATMNAMCTSTSGLAPLYLTALKAVVAFWAMQVVAFNTVPAIATVIADFSSARAAVRTMLIIFENALIAQFMIIATTIEGF